MEKIGNYDVYRSSYDRTNGNRKDAESTKSAGNTKSTEKGKKTEIKGPDSSQSKVHLSSEAKKLLKELKETYGNVDFFVADYETDEEAASYLSRGSSEYSVLISLEELEKMAADKDVKNENLKVLDEAVSKLSDMKNQLGDKADTVSRIGIAIGNDGKLSYFAELEKTNEKQRERIEKQRTDKKEATAEKAAYEKAPAGTHTKRTVVYADSVEKLAEKISQVDWNAVREEQAANGYRFDFTV